MAEPVPMAQRDDDKVNILIVDDLSEKLLVFRTMLEELGQNLVMVNSGSEALREVLQREFAVILLDVNMPDIDGFETAALIRQYRRSAHTPIIFITAYADEMQTAQGYSLGAVDYILSPVVPDVLRSKVNVFVQLYRLRRREVHLADQRVALVQAHAAQAEAEETTRRSNFLSQASRQLGATLDPEEGTRSLLELIVPALAEAAVLKLDVTGELDLVMSRSRGNQGGGRQGEFETQRIDRAPAWLAKDLSRAARENRVIAFRAGNETDPQASASGPGSERFGHALALPLSVGERSLGVLALAMSHDAPAPSQRDRATIEELSSRAAIALENARLYRNLQDEIRRAREAEEKLQDSSRRKDEFLAMLSHELRNPLAPIRSAIEVIRRVAPSDPKLASVRDVVDRQVSHLARLVEELLDVSRINQGKITLKREPLELSRVIAQAVETAQPLIELRRHKLTVSGLTAPVWIYGDFARLAQVLSNLLNNAAKYTEEGGAIELSAHAQGGEAVVTVSDNGIGIDSKLLPEVFELFAQGERTLDRSLGGLGIGLTLVQRLVQLHQGRVEAHSDGAGKGAAFRIVLPCISAVQEQKVGPAPAPAAVPENRFQNKRVLIVDDNEDAAVTVGMFLKLEGHEVKTALDAHEALDCVQQFDPEVLILDIGLPGLNGYELARRVRQRAETAHALLIALTGYAQAEDRAQAVRAGFDYHFVKPADPREIQSVIAGWNVGGRKVSGGVTPAPPR